MDELHDLVEKCVAVATRSQPGDLTSLAQMHTDLQTLRDLVGDRPEAILAVTEAAALVEKIVRGESADPAEAMGQIGMAVHRLQLIIRTKRPNGIHKPG